ncbi:MAG: protein-L-isoaspartate O-methyltransferase, partial [Candidatus Paceibacterota bacterium]
MNTTDIFADNFCSLDELIARMKKKTKVLKSSEIEAAFVAIDRADFVRKDYKVEAYEDYPLPIGSEQTISQPTTVAYMLELLELEAGQTVLDVGCGSGWTTALLAHIVGEEGRVIGVELREELASFGRENLSKYNLPEAEIRAGDALQGSQPEAPFDRILVSAGAKNEVPDQLLEQLTVGGIIVVPVNNALIKITKESEDDLEQEALPGFR